MKQLNNYKCLIIISGFLFLFNNNVLAQKNIPTEIKTSDVILKDFMDKRFGMFIHWGPIALRGTEIGWSRNHQVAQKDYDSLYQEFNPTLFNANEWVKAAKDAGMKYLTITAKHHDGFCLWPSAYTNYNISKTPFKRDVVGELAKACKKYDVKLCIYYTVLDWYHPDYPLHNDGNKTLDGKADMQRFVIYMKNQLKELVTNYHPYMLWFDGNWESPWTKEMGVDMYRYLKQLDPAVIINNRLGKGKHTTMDVETVGDYATPEQEIGQINMNHPWESCITMCKQWAWKPNDEMKTLSQCITTLSRTVAGNGNLLFNVGPMPDGRIEQRQVNRLKEMGSWMKMNGEAIYGTKGGPYKPDSLFSSTRKGNKLFIHLYSNNNSSLTIPAIAGKNIIKAYFLGGSIVRYKEEGGKMIFDWNGNMPNVICSILVLEMNGNMETVPLF